MELIASALAMADVSPSMVETPLNWEPGTVNVLMVKSPPPAMGAALTGWEPVTTATAPKIEIRE
jgi:hypothetical protein